MVILTVATPPGNENANDIEKEYMLIANRTSVFFIRTCDFYHTVKPTKQKVPFLCELAPLKTQYGCRPRFDQMNTVSHLINVSHG